MDIIGIQSMSFIPKGEETPIEGLSIFVSEPLELAKGGKGVRAEKFFLSKNKLEGLDFKPEVGQCVEVLYNRFGKVQSLRLLDEIAYD